MSFGTYARRVRAPSLPPSVRGHRSHVCPVRSGRVRRVRVRTGEPARSTHGNVTRCFYAAAVSQGRGSIPERIRRALYVLSRGRCYAPNCDEPVLVIDRDEVVFVGNVAHIVAASSGGPRGTSRPMNTEAFRQPARVVRPAPRDCRRRTDQRPLPADRTAEMETLAGIGA